MNNNQTAGEQASDAQTAAVVTQKLLGPMPGNDGAALTEAPKTAQQMRIVEVSEALIPAYQKASMLELTDEEVAALTAPFPDEMVEIRPHDGLIYLSHIMISDRLTKVFKPGRWSMMRRREWIDGGTMYAEYVLVIRGCFVGESIGGHPHQPNNPKVNYSDTLESTAAEALRRIAGKRLSCGSQVWNPEYARQWTREYAHQQGGKWYKKASTTSLLHPTKAPAPPTTMPPPPPAPPPPVKAPQKQSSAAEKPLAERIAILRKTLGDRAAWAEGYLRNFTVEGSDANCALMPNEKLEDLNLAQVDYLSKKWINFVERVGEFIAENQGHAPHIAAEMESRFDDAAHEPPGGWQGATNARPSGSPIEEEPVKPTSMRPEPPGYACPSCEDGGDTTLGIAPGGHGYIQCRKCGREWENTVKTTTTAPIAAPDPRTEWFMSVVVPVPRKGIKRDTYMQNPDTILSLYSARHSDNEARRRLWGFLNHYEPKGWVNNKGKDMPPSAVDTKFKEALLAFGAWFEQTHPDEKL